MTTKEDSLFYFDTGHENIKVTKEEVGYISEVNDKEAAWEDDDDLELSVDLVSSSRLKRLRADISETEITGKEYMKRLRNNMEKLYPRPTWAKTDYHKDSHDYGGEMQNFMNPFSILKPLTSDDRKMLLPDIIGVRRYRDVNFGNPSGKSILSLQFHPVEPWVLVVGRDQKVHLFNVQGLKNTLLLTLVVKEWKINSACFSADGKRVFIVGFGPELLIWHLSSGRHEKIPWIHGRREKAWGGIIASDCGRYVALKGDRGNIVLLNSQTLQFNYCFRMNGQVSSITFSPDGQLLIAVGSDCKIYIWETAKFQCLNVIPDDSGTACTAASISSDGAFFAVGSNLGVLNIYRLGDLINQKVLPKPMKSLMNLTTAINSIVFHPSSEFLAYSSYDTNNGLRLVHLQSGRVYSNWPKSTTPLHRVCQLTFETSGKLVSIGNDKGKVLLYGLKHYE